MKLSQEIPFSVALFATVISIALMVMVVFYGVAHADRTAVNGGNSIMTSTPCSTGTTSLAYIQSPFTGATSTAENITIRGTQGATTTDIVIATSTLSSWSSYATSTVAENVIGLAAITANSQFISMAGNTIGPAAGYNSASSGPYRTNFATVVGPTEGLLVISTSTGAGSGGITPSTVSVPRSCTIDITWFPIF